MGKKVWSSLVLAGLAFEFKVLREGKPEDSFSAFTRMMFRTQTDPGKIAFLVGWGALSVWFLPHVIREVNASILNIIEAIEDAGIGE